MCLLNFDVNKKVVVTHSHSRDDCIKINQNNLHLGMMKYDVCQFLMASEITRRFFSRKQLTKPSRSKGTSGDCCRQHASLQHGFGCHPKRSSALQRHSDTGVAAGHCCPQSALGSAGEHEG